MYVKPSEGHIPFEKKTAGTEIDGAKGTWRRMGKLVGSCEIFPPLGSNVMKVVTDDCH